MAEFNFSPIQKVKETLTEDISVVSQFFKPETTTQTLEKFRGLPGIKQISGTLQKLKPETTEEALKVGLVNVSSKDNPVYFDITGAVGSLKNVAGKSARQLTKETVSQADTALSKLINSIKSAKPARKELAKLQSIERGKRAGAVAGILEKGEGEKGFFQALGKLKGELVPEAKKPTFEGLRAVEQIVPKDLQPLAQEARKLSEAEFVSNNIFERSIVGAEKRAIETFPGESFSEKLSSFYRQARGEITPKISKELEPLAIEARKYKSAEEIEEGIEKLTQFDVDELFKKVQQNPVLDVYEKINASTGLKNIFDGVIPQPHQLSLLEETFGSDLISEILKKRPNIEKFKDVLTEVVNIPRSLMASFDMSAPLRQGVIFTLTKPGSATRATKEMFRQAFSQKNFENWLVNLKTEPIYKLAKDSKLYIADPTKISAGLSAKEERFMTNLAQKIPVIGGLIKASERAYTSYLNKLRIDVFKNISNKFIKDGLDPKTDKEVFDSLADFINNATGRGDLGKLNRISQQLNSVFFSPRLIASRFNMLNPAWYVKQSPQVRKEAIKSMFEFIGVGSTILTLAKAGGAEVELDSRSTDFGKIRVGDTRWDIWGGFQQWVRVMSQMASGARKTTTKKEVIPLSAKKFPFETRLDVAERFLKGKLAPVPRLITELMEGQKIFGEEITLEEEALNNTMPLYLQDIREAIEGIGPEALFTVGMPGFFGVGVQTYLEQQKKGTEFKF